ncbi:MAG: flagellar export chaperone FliS [Firmicutes bacterium]|nr:flagellar export chaperone FliS [Candidatus Fermentithermobacillaceae bacterium]
MAYPAGAVEKKALDVYAQSRVSTASPSELVLMMYDAAIKNMKAASEYIAKKDFSAANVAITRAEDIVEELRSSLNVDAGEVALALDSIYDYVYRSLIMSNVKKDAEILSACIKVLEQIRGAWAELARTGARPGQARG